MPTRSVIANAIYLFICFLSLLSCKKELITPEPKLSLPVAIAGPDTIMYLPEQSYLYLDGYKSYDPDAAGRSLRFVWTKLAGPDVQYFQTSHSTASMALKDTGVYSFELLVEDADKNVSRDTVKVTVVWGLSCNPEATKVDLNYQLEATLEESVPMDMSIGKGGKNLVFAGGRTDINDGWGGSDVYSSMFYVYDMVSKTTVKNQLSQARGVIGIAVSSSEVFFAGGILLNDVSDVVDIYDLSAKSMSKAKLSAPRTSISCEVAGNKVFFAGGRRKDMRPSDVVDIFDRNTRTWSSAKLSLARSEISVISSGTKVFFAGGDTDYGNPSSRIDVYDLNTGQWSAMELPSPRFNISSSIVGNSIVFAGGNNGVEVFNKINQADFLDPSSLIMKSECLIAKTYSGWVNGPNMISSVVNGTNLYYLSNSMITRYQADTQKWNISVIPQDIQWIGLASEGNKLYGIATSYDDNGSGYTVKLRIHGISF